MFFFYFAITRLKRCLSETNALYVRRLRKTISYDILYIKYVERISSRVCVLSGYIMRHTSNRNEKILQVKECFGIAKHDPANMTVIVSIFLLFLSLFLSFYHIFNLFTHLFDRARIPLILFLLFFSSSHAHIHIHKRARAFFYLYIPHYSLSQNNLIAMSNILDIK